MTWIERTNQTISLTSPNGDTFEALWIKNNRTLSKKLGIFELPERTGAKVQDLDTGAARYPITFFFEGSDNDLEAERFFKSCTQRGTWNIAHPTKGLLTLQLMSVTEEINPVDNGNITQISTNWIEPSEDSVSISTPQLSQKVFSGIDDLNSSAFDQYVDTVKQDKTIETAAVKNSALAISDSVDLFLSPLINTSSEISAKVKSIQRGITNTVGNSLIPVESLAGQIINLVQLPARVNNDALSRISSYTDFFNGLSGFLPPENSGPGIAGRNQTSQESINNIATMELGMVSGIGALTEIGVTSDLDLKSESIGLTESIFDLFTDITNTLDDSQEIFDSNDIDEQYFSQSQSFSDTLTNVMNTAQFLIQNSFNLLIEKRFILKIDQAPIITTINEYGTLGENDSNFDFFIETNQLKSNDIILMKSGREVIVYV